MVCLGAGAMSNVKVRLLLIGNSGVGKSLLTHRIVEASLGPSAGGDALTAFTTDSTVGANVDACFYPNADSSTVLELVEVTGSRSYCPGSREPLYQGVTGIVLMYARGSESSQRSLYHWFREAERFGFGSKGPKIFVLESALQEDRSGAPGPTTQSTSAQRPKSGLEQSLWLLSLSWYLIERVCLLVLSVLLFGPFQSVVPWRDVGSAEVAISSIEAAVIAAKGSFRRDTVVIGDSAAFGYSREPLDEFIRECIRDATPAGRPR